MPRCPHCDAQIGETRIEPDDIDIVPIGDFVDAYVCPDCEAILGVGEIRGE